MQIFLLILLIICILGSLYLLLQISILKNNLNSKISELELLTINYQESETEAKKNLSLYIDANSKYNEIKGKYEVEISNKFKNMEDFKELVSSQIVNSINTSHNKILEESRQKLTEESSKSVFNVINPFKEELENFKKTVQEHYKQESNEKISLKTELQTEIKNLIHTTQKTSKATEELAKAFTNDKKMQGNWGEIQLERLLEISGLKKDIDFVVQQYFKNDNNDRQFLDILIKLPEDNEIIIDSKVSLVNYQNYINSDTLERETFLKLFIKDIKNNIDALSSKDYQLLIKNKNIDFIVMFIPIEASFILALETDTSLQEYAWKKNIILASNTNLFAILRSIYLILRQNLQNKNSLAIAEAGANMYDKFILFLEDFEKIGSNISTISNTYEKLLSHIKTGRGSLLDRVEKMKELGVKSNKNKEIPNKFKTLENDNLQPNLLQQTTPKEK